MKYVLALIVALVMNAAANLLMKIGMKDIQAAGGLLQSGLATAIRSVLSSAVLMIGLLCFVVNAVFYMYALQSKTLKISIAYPVMVGGGFALIALIARFHPALSERLSWGQLLGVGFVLVGITLIATQADGASA